MKIEFKETLDVNTVRCTTSDERWYQHPITKNWLPSSTWISSYVPSKELAIWMAKKGFDESEIIKNEAAARGSRVHKAIEILSTGGTISHDEKLTDGEGNYNEITVEEYDRIISFVHWVDEMKPKFISTEKTVFNTKHNYAGTLDAIVEIEGKRYILDYKTSANIYLSHEVQISSYFHSDDIEVEGLAILQVGYNKNKKGFKFTELEDKFPLFLSAMSFWSEENLGKMPKQKDYPTTLKLGV